MDRGKALELLRGGPDGVAEWNRLRQTCEPIPDLSHADLSKANLCGADLSGADLYGADLSAADLSAADLSGANLCSADLAWTHLPEADLSKANLCRADLSEADLSGADLQSATVGKTVFSCDLSQTRGLSSIRHVLASPIDVNSILNFKDDLPETFLRGCGLREEVIACFRSGASAGRPIRFYSCFISYSAVDEAFATRLHNDFQAAGIRCWKWDHDARTGRSIWGEIDRAIRVYDKLVLIASESSLKSPYVNDEIERAIQQEYEKEKRRQAGETDLDADVLFPVRIDDYIFKTWQHERKANVIKKVIADARGWDTDPTVYDKVLNRLIRDLRPEDAALPP